MNESANKLLLRTRAPSNARCRRPPSGSPARRAAGSSARGAEEQQRPSPVPRTALAFPTPLVALPAPDLPLPLPSTLRDNVEGFFLPQKCSRPPRREARGRRLCPGEVGTAAASRQGRPRPGAGTALPTQRGAGDTFPRGPSPAMLPEPPLSSRPRRHCAPEAGARGDRVGRVPAPATALGVGATGAQARWPPLDKPFQLEKFITDLETAAAVTSLRGTSAIKNPSVLSSFSATRRQTSLWSVVGRWGRMKNFGASALVTAAGDAGGGGTPTPRPVGRGDLPRPGVQQTFLPLAPLLGPPPASAAAESTTSHPPTAEAAASRCSHEHPCTRSASGSVWFRRKRGGGREF